MNKDRRKRIESVMKRIGELQCELEEIRDEEQDAFDNLPESIQQSERGEAMEAAADALGEAYDELDYVRTSLEEAQEG